MNLPLYLLVLENIFGFYCITTYICVINRKTMAQVNKNEAIVIRVDQSLKNSLQKMADMDNRKLSDYIRVQLMKLVESSKPKK